jgi:sortase A
MVTDATSETEPTEVVTAVSKAEGGPDATPTQVLETVVPEAEGERNAPTVTVPTTVAGAASARVALQRSAHHHLPTIFTWIRNIGAVILLFVAWQLWGTAIAEHHAQSTLQTQFEALIHSNPAPKVTGGGPALIPITTHVPNPAEGTVVAELNIPAIGLKQFVVSGTATDDLAKGPGHYIGSAAPGQAGNVAIAGHRTTHGAPFNRLAELKLGDPIVLTNTSDQHFTYVVAEAPFAVSPADVSVLDNFGDSRITLTTCNPEFSASQRLIVVAKLLGQGSRHAAPPAATPVPYQIVNGATASWRLALLPVVLLEVGVMVALGLFNRRLAAFYGPVGGWLILAPIWVAGFYLLFQTLTNFFPPSL